MVKYYDHTGQEYELYNDELAYAYCTSPFVKRFKSRKVNLIEYIDRLQRINNVHFAPLDLDDWEQLLSSIRKMEKQESPG